MLKRILTSTTRSAILKCTDRNLVNETLPAARAFASKAGVAQASNVQRGEIVDSMREYRIVDDVLNVVNRQIEEDSYSRLFAVISLSGKQFKVTAEDMIAVMAHMPLEVGETIVLEKVLLVGGTDFSIIGKPLIDKNVVRVLATVVEKTLNYEYRRFFHIKRTRLHRSYFFRDPYTVLRINGIQLLKKVNP